MQINLPHPVPDILKGLLIGAVVGQHDAIRSLVVCLGDCSEPLLACCVPNLQLHVLTVYCHCFNLEINTCRKKNE